MKEETKDRLRILLFGLIMILPMIVALVGIILEKQK